MPIELRIFVIVLAWLLVATVIAFAWRRSSRRGRARTRLESFPLRSASSDGERNLMPGGDSRGWIARQMQLAGYEGRFDGFLLIGTTVAMLVIGAATALWFRASGLQQLVLDGVESVPGGLSGMLAPVVIVSPWLVALMIAFVPVLIVRMRRRQRVGEVRRDLPLALDLWATLSEGGLGFDAALDRWQKSQDSARVLATACRGFQRDLLGGMRRSDAFRRLAMRLEVPVLTRFTSAMIQSEHMGSSISETLRLQAEDVRADRREKSLAFAQSLATKRVIPLVVCFLPGLFVWPLGPFFVQLLRIVDQLTAGGST